MADSEKMTINVSAVDLGKIDLLVQEGLYANRSDFIRTALRGQLEKHSLEVQQSVARNTFAIGVLAYDRKDLEKIQAKNEKMDIHIVGLLNLAKDIPVDLAKNVIRSIKVRGVFNASEEIKNALSDRMG